MLRHCWLLLGFWAMSVSAADFATRLQQQEQDPKAAVASLSLHIEQSNDPEDWLLLSHGYLRLLNKDGAMSAVNKALELGLKPELEVAALRHKAMVYGLLFRDTPSAIETLQLAEKHVQYLDHPSKPQLQTSIFESFAQAYNQLGKIPKAVDYANAAINIAVAHQLADDELQARLIAGRLSLQQNNFALAQQHLSEALQLAEALEKTASLGSIHLRLGMAYHKLEQSQLALSHFQQAEQLLQMPERRNQLITVLLNKAQTLQQAGDIAKAAVELQQAMQFSKEINDPTMIAQAYFGQAQLALANKEWQQAEALLAKTQELYTQTRSVTMSTETALAQVDLALTQNQADKAIAYFPKVNDFKSLPLFLQEEFLLKSAKVHALQQQWQQAYQQASLAYDVRFQLDSEQQKQFMDSLQVSLNQQKLEKDLKSTSNNRQFWQIATLLTSSLLLILGIRQWRRRTVVQTPVEHDWHGFSVKAQMALKTQQSLQFVVWQSEALQKSTVPAVLTMLADSNLIASCWHQQQLWLLWKNVDESSAFSKTQQQVIALHQLLGSSWRCWQSDLTLLVGSNIKPAALTGLSQLVTHSFSTYPLQDTPLQFLLVQCAQPVPCSWLGENLQADIQNALQLGLMRIIEQPSDLNKTA